ncbi:MAG: glycosyltransferase family 39 protein [Bacteroidia bacterium]|nr:glycosyltransferase family 39 protein [Bacteroidia bacterium]MDW8014727.1 glycosyltransferase family 39 protein [Bacteroidia bacterium]
MRKVYWVYGLVLVWAVGARLWGLDARPLWFDEAIEFWTAKVSFKELFPSVKSALRDPPLYSFLLHFWLYLGESEYLLRLPSLFFSIAAIGGVMWAGVQVGGWQWGWLPAWSMALAESDIRYAQEVGQYAPAVAFIAWSLAFLSDFALRGRWASFLGWICCSVLALYTYYGSAVSLASAIAALLLLQLWKRESQKTLLITTGCIFIFIAALPLVLEWLPEQLFRGVSPPPFQIEAASFGWEDIRLFPRLAKDFILYQFIGEHMLCRFMSHVENCWQLSQYAEWLIWLPVVGLWVWGAFRSQFHWIYLSILLGLIINYALNQLHAYPFGARYSLVFAPQFWLSMGLSFALLQKSGFAGKGISVLAMVGIVLAHMVFPSGPAEDLRSITQIWLERRTPSDLTYVYYGAVPGLRYQLAQLAPSEFSTEGLPAHWYDSCWQGRKIEFCHAQGLIYGRWIRELPPSQKTIEILESVRYARKFWIIASHIHPGELESILEVLSSSYAYKVIQRYIRSDAALFLLERQDVSLKEGEQSVIKDRFWSYSLPCDRSGTT